MQLIIIAPFLLYDIYSKIMICKFWDAYFKKAVKVLRKPSSIRVITAQHDRVTGKHRSWLVNETPKFYLKFDGQNRIEFPGGNVTLQAGDILLLGANISHHETRFAGGQSTELVINFRSGRVQAIAAGRPEECRQAGAVDRVYLSNEYRQAMLELMNVLVGGGAGFAQKTQQDILRAFLSLATAAFDKVDDQQQKYPLLIEQVLRWLRDNISDSSVNVQSLAHMFSCTPEHLSRQFASAVGLSLGRYISSQRLKLAAKILVSRADLQISEVAYMSGFSSPGYFCTCFKNQYSVTANDFRVRNMHNII